ncbi:Kinesin-like protein KIF21B [Triplophysa tibetana]|uniref:Kinesin-like protein KIF21B n=1 Tax=Triplophysa tibetana TaxID=1572043 RepID=A0A5A9NHD1_9TELE|nr:Kinesin-like protein KIF21B [Triplophysa tibetana]
MNHTEKDDIVTIFISAMTSDGFVIDFSLVRELCENFAASLFFPKSKVKQHGDTKRLLCQGLCENPKSSADTQPIISYCVLHTSCNARCICKAVCVNVTHFFVIARQRVCRTHGACATGLPITLMASFTCLELVTLKRVSAGAVSIGRSIRLKAVVLALSGILVTFNCWGKKRSVLFHQDDIMKYEWCFEPLRGPAVMHEKVKMPCFLILEILSPGQYRVYRPMKLGLMKSTTVRSFCHFRGHYQCGVISGVAVTEPGINVLLLLRSGIEPKESAGIDPLLNCADMFLMSHGLFVCLWVERIRPQMAKEKIEGCHICTSVTPGEPQVLLGKDKAFTYDFVFDLDAHQHQIYTACVQKLIDGCFEGYNATVFAYGQTGSGKTYTMGTSFDMTMSEEEQGIVPRAVRQLFQGIHKRRLEAKRADNPEPEFKVSAQFLELYNEEILDLFDGTRDPETRGRKSNIKIHEDGSGAIYTTGVTSRLVNSEDELLQCLKLGALSRTTASTQMNAQSSRSHAIFTIYLCQMRVCSQPHLSHYVKPLALEMLTVNVLMHGSHNHTFVMESYFYCFSLQEDGEMNVESDGSISQPEYETLTAKFHFVDLAGSERLKRTGATGERAREGISINCGLLALGNVISALGDQSKKAGHVPYRDSKLTRLLQDSLGGNSQTVMIACVSPSDRDFMETLSTLKYANRARNIKNKVIVNQDKTSQQISALRAEIARLQMEVMEYKAGKRVACEEGSEGFSDLFHENSMLQKENDTLRMRVKAMQETIDHLNTRATQLLTNGVNLLLTKTGLSLCSSPSVSVDAEMTDVIRQAKLDVERLKKKERNQRRKSPDKEKGLKKRAKLLPQENGEKSENELSRETVERRENGDGDSDNEPEEMSSSSLSFVQDGMYPLQEDDQVESGCDEDEEEEEENRDDEEFDSDESQVDSDSDSEEKVNLQADLADLTCEIEIKQKLIDELENSQRRLLTLKNRYEEKLILLQNKIRDTQLERDRVLQNLMSMENFTEEKACKVKSDYEKRLKEMNRDLMKLQAAQKEHARLLKNQGRYERELKKLQSEVTEMKKAKVALMKQMKEEQQRRRVIDATRNREIAQLKKEQRRQEYQIRSLESQKHQQEMVLKRKTQEVTALRRMAKPMSERVAGRVTRRLTSVDSGVEMFAGTTTTSREPESTRSVSSIIRQWNTKLNGYLGENDNHGSAGKMTSSRKKFQRKSTSPGFSKSARQKWVALERRIMDIVMQRMTITNVEADMDRLIRKREELSVQQEALLRKREKLLNESFREEEEERLLQEMNEEIEVLNANIDYISDSLSDCQATIVQIEETKDELDSVDTSVVISSCSLAEARSLLEYFLKASIDKGLQVAQKESQIRLLEGQLRQTDVIGSSQNHMILDALREKAECIPELHALIHNVQQENGYASTDEEASELSQASESCFPQMKLSASQDDFKRKVEPRLSVQMKAVSAEYLGPILDPSTKNITKSLASLSEIHENGLLLKELYSRELVTRTICLPVRGHTFPRQSRGSDTSPLTRRQSSDRGQPYRYLHHLKPATYTTECTLSHLKNCCVFYYLRSPDVGYTPPSSPPLRTRNDRNVFSRLTSNQSQGSALDKSDDSDSSLSEMLRSSGAAYRSIISSMKTTCVFKISLQKKLAFSPWRWSIINLSRNSACQLSVHVTFTWLLGAFYDGCGD